MILSSCHHYSLNNDCRCHCHYMRWIYLFYGLTWFKLLITSLTWQEHILSGAYLVFPLLSIRFIILWSSAFYHYSSNVIIYYHFSWQKTFWSQLLRRHHHWDTITIAYIIIIWISEHLERENKNDVMLSSSSFFYWILFITSQAFLLIPQTWPHISKLLISDYFITMTDDFVFVFVLIIIVFVSLLVLLLANMKINILEKSPFSISDEFLYFSLFFHFIYFLYLLQIHISHKFLFFCFSLF